MPHAIANGRILIVDSATKLGPDPRGKVVLAASHGGAYCGFLAARAELRGIVLHDAGIGKDGAGLGALAYLDALAIPAATVDYRSARIGDGDDLAAGGVISHVNQAAARLGCASGQPSLACARLILDAPLVEAEVQAQHESRFLIREEPGGPRVWGCDSNSLVRADDEGDIVVTGSHGALIARTPRWAGPQVLAAFFNDAGGGPDGAGATRLPMLDGFGIAAVTVDAFSARIGDARSTYEDGVLSHLNQIAARSGAKLGMRSIEFIDILCGRSPRRP